MIRCVHLSKAGNELTAHGVAERLIDWSKTDGITMVCTSLLDEMHGHMQSGTPLQISTLADTWIHLNYLVQAGERNRGLSIIKSRGTAHSNQVRELILSDAGVTLADIYTAGGEVLMGALRWEKESAERVANEVAEVAGKLKLVTLDAEEAVLEVRAKSLQTELVAKQVEKTLLTRTSATREGALSRGRLRMEELRGGDAALPGPKETPSRHDQPAPRLIQIPALYHAGDIAEHRAGHGQPLARSRRKSAGTSRNRNCGRVSGTEARPGGRHFHDTHALETRAVTPAQNHWHAEPDHNRRAGAGTGKRRRMNPLTTAPRDDASDEISGLIETLFLTEQRLEELTAGEVDTVASRDGRTFMLRRAKEQSRQKYAAKQTAVQG